MKVKLHEKQLAVATDTHRFRVICAGRRFGKSVLAQLVVLKWATENPGVYFIVSPTYKQSKQIHWRGLQQIIPRDWIAKKNEVELSITLRNGSVIELKGAENPDALRGVKLRGLVIDEIASIRNWDWLWSEVLRPTLTDYAAPALFISTPKGFNHFYHLFQQGQGSDPTYKSWRFTSYDNPYIPKDEIDQAKKELTEDTFAQEYLADFRRYTGLVYKQFSREVHVRDLPDFRPVYYLRGCDRGFRNATAVPLIAVDADDHWYQIAELYKTEMTNPMLAHELEQLTQTHGVGEYELSTMDSAAAGDIQELSDLGQDFIPVKKRSGEKDINYVAYKVQKWAERLKVRADGTPGYYVHPRCEKTIWEHETYAYPESVDDLRSPNEQPLKVNDHMMDALGDLNIEYLHLYEPEATKIGAGKIPGTFVPASVPQEEENDWGVVLTADEWGEVAA